MQDAVPWVDVDLEELLWLFQEILSFYADRRYLVFYWLFIWAKLFSLLLTSWAVGLFLLLLKKEPVLSMKKILFTWRHHYWSSRLRIASRKRISWRVPWRRRRLGWNWRSLQQTREQSAICRRTDCSESLFHCSIFSGLSDILVLYSWWFAQLLGWLRSCWCWLNFWEELRFSQQSNYFDLVCLCIHNKLELLPGLYLDWCRRW